MSAREEWATMSRLQKLTDVLIVIGFILLASAVVLMLRGLF